MEEVAFLIFCWQHIEARKQQQQTPATLKKINNYKCNNSPPAYAISILHCGLFLAVTEVLFLSQKSGVFSAALYMRRRPSVPMPPHPPPHRWLQATDRGTGTLRFTPGVLCGSREIEAIFVEHL